MKKAKSLEAVCFGLLNLLAGVLALLFAMAIALFQPHGCFGLLGMFSCILKDDWLRPYGLSGLGLCLVGYLFIRQWEQPAMAYALALLVIGAGAVWCLTLPNVKLVFVPIALAIPAFFIMRSARKHDA
jgi:hypothetical protein